MNGTEKPAAAAELNKKPTGHQRPAHTHTTAGTHMHKMQSDPISQEQKQMLHKLQPLPKEIVTNQCCNPCMQVQCIWVEHHSSLIYTSTCRKPFPLAGSIDNGQPPQPFSATPASSSISPYAMQRWHPQWHNQTSAHFGWISQEMCSIWALEMRLHWSSPLLRKSSALIFAHLLPLPQTNPNQSNSIANANHSNDNGWKNLTKFDGGKTKRKIKAKSPT